MTSVEFMLKTLRQALGSMRPEPQKSAGQVVILQALSDGKAASYGELRDLLGADRQFLAANLHQMYVRDLLVRSGECGFYRYAIADKGRALIESRL